MLVGSEPSLLATVTVWASAQSLDVFAPSGIGGNLH